MPARKISSRQKNEEDEGFSQCTPVVVVPEPTCTTVVKIATLEIATAKIEDLHADFCLSRVKLFDTENVKLCCERYGKQDIMHSDDVLTPSETSLRPPLSTGYTYPQPLESLSEISSETSTGYAAFMFIPIVVGIAGLMWLYESLHAKTTSQSPQHTVSRRALQPKTKQEHKGVIEFTPVGGSQIRDRVERQACRALPNERLKTVFGIENAFTTVNIPTHDAFKAAAIKKMQEAIHLDKSQLRTRDGDWTELRELARASVAQTLSQETEEVRLVDLIRVVTLTVSFRFLFSIPDERLLARDTMNRLILIGQRINDLWISSKDTTQPLTPWTSSANKGIHDALRDICSSSDARDEVWDPLIPTQNPLNFLLPAYETMWRAVLSGILEVYFGMPAPETSTWHFILQSYVANPSRAEFKHTSLNEELLKSPNSKGLSASDIVKEILRLYPPTKRVYRRFSSTSSSYSSLATSPDTIASIESLHHDTSTESFGPDALVFRPERWVDMRKDLRAETSDSELQISDNQVQKNQSQLRTNDSEVPSTSAGEIQTSDTQAQTKDKTCPEPTSTASAIKELEESRGFIPFARFCPAGKGDTQGFGMKMIGLLVGVLGEGLVGERDLGVQWKLFEKKEGAEYILAFPLSGDRGAFEDIMIVRKKT